MDYYTELDGIKLLGTTTPPAADLIRHHDSMTVASGEDSSDDSSFVLGTGQLKKIIKTKDFECLFSA